MLHYIRDHYLPEITDSSSYEYHHVRQIFTLYHLLRCMGWSWLWECDGQTDDPRHVDDADMEASGVSDWTALGTGALAKDTGIKHQLSQSLKITSSAVNDGVECASMTVLNGETYCLALWAANDSGGAWNVDVDYTGGGGWTNVGTIPDNGGVWTLYMFTYSSSGVVNSFRVVDNNNTQGFVHIDSVMTHLDIYEHNYHQAGTDGDVQNGDEFHSTAYTFVSGDINKTLCYYDPTNLANTGAYTVTGVNAGNAVLDLRVGGAETLTNTSVGNLVWRLIDPINDGPVIGTSGWANASEGSGFGLESPHSTSWRMFWRGKFPGASAANNFHIWTAPEDTEFSVINGMFANGPSVFNGRIEPYKWDESQVSMMTGQAGCSSGGHRFYAMIAGDGAFLTWAGRHISNGSDTMGILGYVSTDTEYAEGERFCQLCRSNKTGLTELDLIAAVASFGYYGMCGTDTIKMYNAAVGCLSTLTYAPATDVNSRANPFSSEEWMTPMVLLRGYDFSGPYGEIEMDAENAFFVGRENMTAFITFDSEAYIHLLNGIIWPWPSVTVIA